MSMGKKPSARRQLKMWLAAQKLARSPGHSFYERLNQVLEKAGFDAFVEGLCGRFYAAGIGRPSLRPGRYFRMLLLGYFEGLNSERAIAWRVADSMSVRAFLDLDPEETPPNHSTLSRTRRSDRRGDARGGVHAGCWGELAEAKTGAGARRSGSMRRRWKQTRRCAAWCVGTREKTMRAFVRGLAKASGVPTPTREERGSI